jgi:hypothetical protein
MLQPAHPSTGTGYIAEPPVSTVTGVSCCTQVSDLTLIKDKNKLIGCSFNKAFVGLWVVDLKDVSGPQQSVHTCVLSQRPQATHATSCCKTV